MGYSHRPSAAQLEVNTFPNAAILSDTTPRDTELVPFPGISYLGSLTAAYMDIILPNIRNTRAGANHSNGFILQIKDGAAWRNCIVVPDPSIWMAASEVETGDFTFCGTTDIKAYIPADTVIYPRMQQHSTDGNAYYFYDVRCRLRLYFIGG